MMEFYQDNAGSRVLFSRAREVQAIHRFHANVVVRIIHARATCMNIMHYKAGKKSGNP